jgi:hypothetical protein
MDYVFAAAFVALIALYCAKSYLEEKLTGSPSRMDLLGALRAQRGHRGREAHPGQDQWVIDHRDC